MVSPRLVQSFSHAALSPDPDLAVAALMIARLERPALDARPYLDQLDAYGDEARRRVAAAHRAPRPVPDDVDPERFADVMALNEYLFDELGFVGNQLAYEDPRNSCLNEVIERRKGIPITLALLYMEVARRAGVPVVGINFPGHFLVRCPADRARGDAHDLIIDAFNGGAVRAPEGPMPTATKPQILARMLRNLKQVYLRLHSFPQARDAVSLLLAIDPDSIADLRDRGLLSYQLRDHGAALHDLQAYLDRSPGSPDTAAIKEHITELRKKTASLN